MRSLLPLLLLLLLPAVVSANEPVSSRPAVGQGESVGVLSNGQRWERISLRHIDVRTLAPLFGATPLPVAEPWWGPGGPGVPSLTMGWLGSGLVTLSLFQQGGRSAMGTGGAAANPAALPVLADPLTNLLIVDP